MKRILLQFPPRFSLAPRGLGRFVNPKGYPAVYSWIGGTDMGSDSIATNGCRIFIRVDDLRSEEHTSELQSRENLVCRLLLEKKKRSANRLCRQPPGFPI